jgi:hypothetical protein
MKRKHLELMLWTLACAMALWAGVAWMRGPAAPEVSGVALPAASELQVPYPPETLHAASITLIETDPFRLERRPADVAYTPGGEHEAASPTPPPAPPRPVLALTGTIGGPPWAALIEGMPGREGSVLVREGESMGELRIARVTRESVVVTGADTTWNLKLRRAWH